MGNNNITPPDTLCCESSRNTHKKNPRGGHTFEDECGCRSCFFLTLAGSTADNSMLANGSTFYRQGNIICRDGIRDLLDHGNPLNPCRRHNCDIYVVKFQDEQNLRELNFTGRILKVKTIKGNQTLSNHSYVP